LATGAVAAGAAVAAAGAGAGAGVFLLENMLQPEVAAAHSNSAAIFVWCILALRIMENAHVSGVKKFKRAGRAWCGTQRP
jgi:hypothetical protein